MSCRRCRLAGITLVFLIASGCDSPEPEDMVKQSLRQWKEAAEIVEHICDEKTLREAAPKLEALAQRIVELNKQAADQNMDVDTRRRLAADNRKETQAVFKRYNAAAESVRPIPGAEAVVVRFRRSASRAF